MAKNYQKPTESELEILQLLWEAGPASVRSINDKLHQLADVVIIFDDGDTDGHI